MSSAPSGRGAPTATRRPGVPDLAVFVSGVASIGLEILAGRVVGPEFGSSIYTWGSIIAVFLGALGLGYHLGGRRAPTHASRRALASLLLRAALFVAFVLALGDVVLRASDALPLPPRFAPLVPVTVLFGPPVFLLGYISPYAAELVPEPTSGSASGRVYALGTIGSLVGAFGTTFFLIPWLSVPVVELAFGLLLVATAVAVGWRPSRIDATRALLVVLLLSGGFALEGAGVATPGTVVYESTTPEQQELRVVDDGDVRTMYLDGAPQSATYLDERDGYVFTYPRYFHVAMLMQDDVERVLFVGGGGFSGPQRFLREYPNVTVDVVELDPGVVRAAERYFGLNRSHPRLNVYSTDGRQFLERTDREYDVILLDAYRQDQVPRHMTTVEFMELAESRLDGDGVLVANLISAADGPAASFFRAQYKTMQRAFPHVYAFPTSDTPFVQNIELVATKREAGFTEAELLARARSRDVGLNLTDEVGRYRGPDEIPTADAPVLRDDSAPVERLLDPQLGRRYVPDREGGAESANATVTTTARNASAMPRPPRPPGERASAQSGWPSTMATPELAPMRSAPASNSLTARS